MEVQKGKSMKKKPRPKSVDHQTSAMMIPYVEGVSEAVARAHKRHDISMAMRPHTTIRYLLVHPNQ